MIDGMRRLISLRGDLLGAAAVTAVLALCVLASSAQALPIPLSSVACPSGSECIAVGEGQEGTFEPVSPVSPTTIPALVDSGGSLVGVACPAGSGYCTAVAGGGQEVSFEPGSGTTISAPVEIDENGGLIGLACPTETRCTAVDSSGYEVTFNPVSGVVVAGSFERIDASSGITSVACPAEKQCTVVDFNGQEVTFEPVSNREISLERLEVGELSSVACPSSTQCTAVDAGGHEVTFEPASPGPPPSPLPTIDGTNGLTSVACPTGSKYCTAVDSSGHEVTFEPSLPGTPTPATIDGAVGLTGVACPTASQCTAVDRHGHEVTFEPKSGATNPSSTTIGGGGAPSSTKSKISVKPNPTLVSEPGGLVSFEVIVTVEDENEELLQGDSVSLEVNRFEGSTPVNPEITNSKGEATFAKVTCFAPYCEAGDGVSVTATDPSGLSLTTMEHVSGIFFVGKSYEGQTDTLEVRGLPEADEQEQPVTLSLNGLPVALSVPCTTSSTGSLPFAGELDACTFTVPTPGELGVPIPTSVTSVPAVVTVGTEPFKVSFPLQPAPSVALSPTSGLERSAISVNGIGFSRDQSVKVGFTPAGGSTPTASTECHTNGEGEIINDEPIGKPDSCDLTVPADSPVGKGIVSVEGYATAHAPFTVEEATLVGIGIASNLPGNVGGSGGHLYVGETATLEIEGHYNTGTIKSLEVPAGDVSWSPEPQPSGAIELKAVNGHTIGLTAKERTKSTGAGVVKVTYEGFEAKSEPIAVRGKPCKGCTFVNGALLNVKAQVPEGLGSKPLGGAIANIIQGVGSAPVFTLPPPCIPENGGCSSTYPALEESATETCTTLGAGECQLIAGEGTEGVATEIEDTITLTAPTGYSVTGVSGCHSVSGSSEAPVCHVLLGELSEPSTIMFELKPWPIVTVDVSGPEVVIGTPQNEDVNGLLATIQPVGGSSSEASTCVLGGGVEAFLTGTPAHCEVSVAPGEYSVSIPASFGQPGNMGFTQPGPQSVTLKPGENHTVSFSSATEPHVKVEVGGPEISFGPSWYNEDTNGAVVTMTPIDGTPGLPVTCKVTGGEYTLIVGGKTGFCEESLTPGTYEVLVEKKITYDAGMSYEGHVYVTSTDPQIVTLKPGDSKSISFNTAEEYPLVTSASGTTQSSAEPAEAIDGTVLMAKASGGTGTVDVGQYGSDPAGAPAFETGGPYIDVFLSSGNTFTSLSFTDCDLDGGEYLHWYENGAWPVVSDETSPSGSPPCITVTINETTTPNLKEMAGTVFGVALPPTSTAKSSTSASALSTSLSLLPPTTAPTGSVSLAPRQSPFRAAAGRRSSSPAWARRRAAAS